MFLYFFKKKFKVGCKIDLYRAILTYLNTIISRWDEPFQYRRWSSKRTIQQTFLLYMPVKHVALLIKSKLLQIIFL